MQNYATFWKSWESVVNWEPTRASCKKSASKHLIVKVRFADRILHVKKWLRRFPSMLGKWPIVKSEIIILLHKEFSLV